MAAADALSPTARAILGMLRVGPRTGYEIKQKVDVSTRFFWAASYGQIYPELKRLEGAGLVVGEDDPHGGRRRTAYRLTPAGEHALHDWLHSAAEPTYALRDEALLKLFFAGELPRDERLAIVRSMRRRHEQVLDRLGDVHRQVCDRADDAQLMTLDFGLELHCAIVDWCRRAEARAMEREPAIP